MLPAKDDLELFRQWIERNPEAFKKSIKTLREQFGLGTMEPEHTDPGRMLHDVPGFVFDLTTCS